MGLRSPVTGMEILGTGVGNPLSPLVNKIEKPREKVAPAPSLKTGSQKNLVYVQFENFSIVQDIQPKRNLRGLSNKRPPQPQLQWQSAIYPRKWLQAPPPSIIQVLPGPQSQTAPSCLSLPTSTSQRRPQRAAQAAGPC